MQAEQDQLRRVSLALRAVRYHRCLALELVRLEKVERVRREILEGPGLPLAYPQHSSLIDDSQQTSLKEHQQ